MGVGADVEYPKVCVIEWQVLSYVTLIIPLGVYVQLLDWLTGFYVHFGACEKREPVSDLNECTWEPN